MLFEYVCGGELFSYLRNAGRFNNATGKVPQSEFLDSADIHSYYRPIQHITAITQVKSSVFRVNLLFRVLFLYRKTLASASSLTLEHRKSQRGSVCQTVSLLFSLKIASTYAGLRSLPNLSDVELWVHHKYVYSRCLFIIVIKDNVGILSDWLNGDQWSLQK